MEKMTAGGVTAAKGFSASGMHCGIRKNKSKPDLAMIYSEVPCTAAAVYTQNLVQGAPIRVTKKHLANGIAQGVIINSGNANTCNADGEEKALEMCEIAAGQLSIPVSDVVVASTGVIGQVLPIEPIRQGAKALKEALSPTGSLAAATAIMTTDTFPKEATVSFSLDGKPLHMGGIAKGSGMIHPNMATMLSFVTTDCAISAEMLQLAISRVTAETFNMVSVDGDCSTNDTFCILANGLGGNDPITEENDAFRLFCEKLLGLCKNLSKQLAADGEGATKLLVCQVTGGKDRETARAVAKSVICSALLKAAMFGRDANWGRVLCAIGYAGADVKVNKIDVAFSSSEGELAVCRQGHGIDFSEELAAKVLSPKEIDILVSLNDGDEAAEAYGCDLTYDYVRINGDYRT